VWEGKRIIPSSWVDRAQEGKVPATFGFHYANLWWSLPEKGAYMALGRHWQLILVIPKLDVVAVMTGALKDNEFYSVAGLIDDISRAVKSDKALQANSITIALLANAIRQAATEKASAIGGMPELAKAIGVDVMTGPARICDLAAGQQRGTAVAHHLTRVSGRAAAGGAASGTWKSAVVLFTIQSGPLKKQHSCELEK